MSFITDLQKVLRQNIREYGMFIALFIIMAIFTATTDGIFISSRNISNLLNQTGYIAVLAVGMTLVIVIRHIDLSVGFLAGFLGAVAAIAMVSWGLPVYVVIPMVLLLGALALGALDRRLATLPGQYQQLLADTGALLIDQPEGLTSGEYERLCALAPRFAELCEKLAGYGVPETLHHDDFHDGNILVRDSRYTFADWGESCVAHPFCTLVVTLRGIAYRQGWAEGAPKLAQLRDSYLARWAGFGSQEKLLAAFALAQRVGRVCRALTWYRVVSHLEEPFKSADADAVPGWLQVFLAAETAA